MINKQGAVATAMIAATLLTVAAPTYANHGYDMFDLDGVAGQDPTAADIYHNDNILDYNTAIVNGYSVELADFNTDGHPDGFGFDFSGPSGQPDGVFDAWLVDYLDGNGWQQFYNPDQYPPPVTQAPAPGPGEVILKKNPDGSTDIIFGGVAELPFEWEVEAFARTNPCYEYTWTTPDNQICVSR